MQRIVAGQSSSFRPVSVTWSGQSESECVCKKKNKKKKNPVFFELKKFTIKCSLDFFAVGSDVMQQFLFINSIYQSFVRCRLRHDLFSGSLFACFLATVKRSCSKFVCHKFGECSFTGSLPFTNAASFVHQLTYIRLINWVSNTVRSDFIVTTNFYLWYQSAHAYLSALETPISISYMLQPLLARLGKSSSANLTCDHFI
jgi:hypothetical protein